MKIIAFKGATRYELSIRTLGGHVYITVLRPRYWCWRNTRRFISVGFDEKDL